MRVYLGGPMRGFDLFNFPAIDAAVKVLRAKGHGVFSPAEHDRETGFDETRDSLDGFDLKAAMRWDIASILEADAVMFLPGFHLSQGCQIERTVAEAIGCSVYLYDPASRSLTPLDGYGE